MSTGDSADILNRVKQLIPRRWFQYTAPIRDAILGGLSDGATQSYAWITYARMQSRIATSTGIFLDLIGWDFFSARFVRRFGETDGSWRPRILKEILRPRQTRVAITQMLTDLTGTPPLIFETFNPNDEGCYDVGTFAFDAGDGWGSLDYPNQVFITAYRPNSDGVPLVSGFDMVNGGWDVGSFAFIDMSEITGLVTDAEIYARIAQTTAAGITPWTTIQNGVSANPTIPGMIFDIAFDSTYIAVI